jgi:uncharacterized protein involved in copper resistance
MASSKWTLPLVALTIVALGGAGCQPSDVNQTEEGSPPAATEMNHDAHGMDDHDHAAHGDQHGTEKLPTGKSDMDKMMEAIADMPEADRKSIMKQHYCPVSGEMLGVMGEPKKIDVNGQSVWICCDGCKDKLLAEPEKYLAKLKE